MKLTIGKPMANAQIYIVDKFMNPLPIGVTGEICIAGDCVGAGYLNRPELTEEKFVDNPFGKGKLYKTGDLGYWCEDGNVAFVGRNDFQVKIRGLRIELGEIESAISNIEGINNCVVVARKNSDGRQLICAFYTGREIPAKEIRKTIGKKLPKYMLPHIFTHIDKMPMTPSGKINRKALMQTDTEYIETDTEYVPPENEKQKMLCEIAKSLLKVNKVGIKDNFIDLGGDSLKAIEYVSKVSSCGYKIEARDILNTVDFEALSQTLKKSESNYTDTECCTDIPATPAQMRVYTAQNMDENSTLYNIPYAFKVESVDVDRLQKAVDKMLSRHEILKTRFENKDGKIIQVFDPQAKCSIERLESGNFEDFIRPFDLSKAPLLRIGVYKNVILTDIHHIIADGMSIPVFFNELNEFYMGRAPKADTVQYKQFAIEKRDYSEQEKYWLSVFGDEIPVLEMNTDFPRPEKQSFDGAAVYGFIDIDLHNKIKEKCRQMNITPFVFYMAGFNILLFNYSSSEDTVVGIPAAGRESKYLNTIGMFVNTVAFRSRPAGDKAVSDYLDEVKEISLSGLKNQDYPIGEIIKKKGLKSEGRNPLFDIMFAYQADSMTDITFADKKAEIIPVPITKSKYDFTFNIMPRKNDVVLMAEYCTALYKEKTIKRMIESYKTVLSNMLDTDKKIYDIRAIPKDEEQRILFDFNNTVRPYPTDQLIHQLFEEQALVQAGKPAVLACDKTLTFKEVNENANRIAYSLMKKGIQRGDVVAVILPRNSHLMPAIFAVLKTGAAYMPIAPSYPKERVEYLLEESKSKYVIDETNIYELLNNDNTDNPDIPVLPSDYFCALHTSGSTGRPKLTVLRHSNLLNFLYSNSDFWEGVDTVVSVTIVTFDVFMQESVLSLAKGKKMVLASEEQISSQNEFEKIFEKENNVMLFSTPTKLTTYIKQSKNCDFLKKTVSLICGGEVLSKNLFEMIQNNMGSLTPRFTEDNNVLFNRYISPEIIESAAYVKKDTSVRDNDFYKGQTDGRESSDSNKLKHVKRIYNIYGPAEATMWVTYASWNISDNNKNITNELQNEEIK